MCFKHDQLTHVSQCFFLSAFWSLAGKSDQKAIEYNFNDWSDDGGQGCQVAVLLPLGTAANSRASLIVETRQGL